MLSSVQERRSQHELYATFRGQLAEQIAPIGGAIAPGAPVAILQIPRIGLHNLMVVEGTSSSDLQAGPPPPGYAAPGTGRSLLPAGPGPDVRRPLRQGRPTPGG